MILVRRLWLADFLISTFMAAIIKAIDDTFGINISRTVIFGLTGEDAAAVGKSPNPKQVCRYTQQV